MGSLAMGSLAMVQARGRRIFPNFSNRAAARAEAAARRFRGVNIAISRNISTSSHM